jgi:hypothetical protein
MKKTTFYLAVAAVLGGYTGPSFALGTVSRACNLSRIPTEAQGVAVNFFNRVGAPSSVLSLPSASDSEKSHWWVLESLTLDWGQVRYYLFAASKVFYAYNVQYSYPSNTPSFFYTPAKFANGNWQEYQSAWTAQQITDAMRADPTFSPYYANRQKLYSARAGSPNIIERYSLSFAGAYYVMGKHWYYDSQMNIKTELRDTATAACNFTNMGNLSSFGEGLFDR